MTGNSACRAGLTQCDLTDSFGGTCDTSTGITNLDRRICHANDRDNRCFRNSGTNSAECAQMVCSSDATSITVVGPSGNATCTTPLAIISVPGGVSTFECPRDFARFCDLQTCEDWCADNGYCVNGVCHLLDCSAVDPTCIFC